MGQFSPRGGAYVSPFLKSGASLLVIDIRHNIESIEEYLDDMKHREVVNGARRAVNRSLVTARKTGAQIVRDHYKTGGKGKLTIREIKSYLKISKAKGGTLSSLVGDLYFGKKTYGLIKFVKGSQDIIKQKGVKVQKRRKLKVEIVRGKTVTLKKAFIQRAKTKQVFKGRAGQGFKTQAVASNSVVLLRPSNLKKLGDIVFKRFEVVFQQELNFRLTKLAERQRKKRMKKV